MQIASSSLSKKVWPITFLILSNKRKKILFSFLTAFYYISLEKLIMHELSEIH